MGAELLSYEQAAQLIAEQARRVAQNPPRIERIELAHASGRILAAPLRADDDQPPFPRSTRDGYACRAAEASAHIALPIAGSTHAGETPAGPLPAHSAWEIMTGAPVPEGADCVVMLEHVAKSGDSIQLLSTRTIQSGDNVVAKGAQARKGDEQLAPGVILNAAQIALAASCGYAHLDIFVRPRVAILATGDELVPVDAIPSPGKIRNSNTPMLAALVTSAGAEAIVLPTAADTAEALDSALAMAMKADMLLISGGVSAGKYDLVEPALARLGAQFHFTGVKIQPGKPLVFGELPKTDGTTMPLFGLPGNPISSAATFLLFAAPILAALAGGRETYPRFVLAHLSRDTDRKSKPGLPLQRQGTVAGGPGLPPQRQGPVAGGPGLTRFLPALCTFNSSVRELPQVATVPWHGSGDLTAFAQSNCFVVIPEGEGFLSAGSTVRILLH